MSPSLRTPPPSRAEAVARVNRALPSHPSTWAAIRAVAADLGISAETLRSWVRQAEIDAGRQPGMTTAEQQELRRLRLENTALRRLLATLLGSETALPPRPERLAASRRSRPGTLAFLRDGGEQA